MHIPNSHLTHIPSLICIYTLTQAESMRSANMKREKALTEEINRQQRMVASNISNSKGDNKLR